MKRRGIALLMALVLAWGGMAPVQARAAQTEPLVLQSRTNSSGVHSYSYDGAGNCILEERSGSTFREETHYVYSPSGTLEAEYRLYNGENQESIFYDEFGNMTEMVRYDKGNPSCVWLGYPEYDEYGRLTRYTKQGPCDEEYTPLDSYEEEIRRYEYLDTPESLFFGHYEQDGNTGNGSEPIEWQILETDGDQMLLVSKYALDSRVYHSRSADVTWKDSELRRWLNNGFVEEAFTPEEQYQIRQNQPEPGVGDMVFLLSLEETKQYFPTNSDRLCQATKYAVRQGAYVNRQTGGSWWLLRTPGTVSGNVMSINSDGTIDRDGGRVTSAKGTVRPAIWVRVTAMGDNAVPARIHYKSSSYEAGSEEPVFTESRLSTYNEAGILIYDQCDSYDARGFWTFNVFDYDDAGNPESADFVTTFSTGETDAHRYTYENTYDRKGNLTKQVEYFDGIVNQTIQMRYDKNGRMTSRTGYMGTETWKYDRYGNMLQYTRDGRLQEENTYIPLRNALGLD